MAKCKATIDTQDARTLVCDLPAKHQGPVHIDKSGERWGDTNLRMPIPPEGQG